MTPMVTMVVVTHNRKNSMIRLLDSLKSRTSLDMLEIIAVDDASTDGTSEKISLMFPKVRMLRVTDQVFPSRARNIGARYSQGKYILFVDDDVVIEVDSIERISAFMESHSDYGIAGPLVTYLKNKDQVWHAGVCYNPRSFIENQYIWNHARISDVKRAGFQNCCYSPGVFIIRREIFNKLKGFDSENFAISYEELDLALRTQFLGYKIACVLSAMALHDIEESSVERPISSMRAFHNSRSRTRFYLKYLKWKTLWLPAYFLGFTLMNLPRNNMSLRKRLDVTVSYLKGIVHGIAGK